MTLTSFTPTILTIDPTEALNLFQNNIVGHSVWAPADLQDWLEDQGLSDYEAENYTNFLIDHMLLTDIGEEYGGITPWMGEGYQLW